MRHGVCVGLARPSRGTCRRHRRVNGPALDRPATPAPARPRVPAAPRRRRARAVPGRRLRPRDLGVRCLPVGRPRSLASGGGPDPATGRRADLLVNSSLLTLCMPAEDGVAATDRLLRPAFGMFRIQWPGDPSPDRRVIDAGGQVVAPGLIDIHTHSDFTLPINQRAESKIRQGVTLEVVTLPAAIHKTTGAWAAALGLDDRGVLRNGYWAD